MQSGLVAIMSILTFIIGLVLGWFIANLWTVYQIGEMSLKEVKKLKHEADYLINNNKI